MCSGSSNRTLFLAALIRVGGSLGDHFGRRRVYGFGVTIFALSSVACGLSQNATQLIIARGVQGTVGALLVPGSLTIAIFGIVVVTAFNTRLDQRLVTIPLALVGTPPA